MPIRKVFMSASSIAGPVLIVFVGMVSTATGSAVAKFLFPHVGPEGATALRLVISAAILMAWFRPWRTRLDRPQINAVLLYGTALGLMNLLFYAAIARIPVGVAVAFEIAGPLSVALFGSRRLIDLVWVALAVAGLLLLLPIGQLGSDIDPLGALMAMGAGACWAGYIVFGRRAGTRLGSDAVAWALALGAALSLPFGAAGAVSALGQPEVLALALLVALLSSAIPYALDIHALPKIPARLFGILMSAQPALATLSGLILLGELLTPAQFIGIAAVALAALGSALRASSEAKPSSRRR
jgi:inner membrane transporter RhtA